MIKMIENFTYDDFRVYTTLIVLIVGMCLC